MQLNAKGKLMIFDLDMLKRHYDGFAEKVDKAKEKIGKPLTLAEKILYELRNSVVMNSVI